MPLARDLLHPSLEEEKKKHKKETAGSKSKFLLHGCKMSRLLQDHHGFQPRSDCSALCRLFNSAVPAHRRKGQTHRRLFI